MARTPDQITIDAASNQLGALLEHLRNAQPSEQAIAFRASLGLPIDRPIVMTGHQPGPWHAGILSKYIAADAIATQTGAAKAWLVVDQDTGEPGSLSYPEVVDGFWVHSEARVLNAPPKSAALTSCPAELPLAPPNSDTHPTADLWRRALADNAQVGSLADQASHAIHELIQPHAGDAATFNATSIASTSAFADMLEAMRTDHAACIDAYNHAIITHPSSGTRLLITGSTRSEIPLWRLDSTARRVIYSDDTTTDRLAPRALLMTALVRTLGCDLFIHGLGGAAYDPAMEHWLDGWKGSPFPAEGLAPTLTVTATLRLDLGVTSVTEQEANAAKQKARRARTSPALLGDASAASRKQELLDAMRTANEIGKPKAPIFAELKRLEAATAADNAEAVRAIDAWAIDAQQRWEQRAVLNDRTWPFWLHQPEDLAELAEAIRARIAEAIPTPAP